MHPNVLHLLLKGIFFTLTNAEVLTANLKVNLIRSIYLNMPNLPNQFWAVFLNEFMTLLP